MEASIVVLVASESQGADQDLMSARRILPSGSNVIGVWTGDPFLRPRGWEQATSVDTFPFGLLKLCMDARPLDFLAALNLSHCLGEAVLYGRLERLTLNSSFKGLLACDSRSGYIADLESFADKDGSSPDIRFSGIPDCSLISPMSDQDFSEAIRAIFYGKVPANLTVSPVGMRPVVELDYGEANLFVPTYRPANQQPDRLYLPGGIEVDAAVRSCARQLLKEATTGSIDVPDPFGPGFLDFLSYLEEPVHEWRSSRGRYWEVLWAVREDLRVNFPLPEGRDFESYREWTSRRHLYESSSPLIQGFGEPYGERFNSPSSALEEGGLNLIGYHSRLSSQGEVARTLGELLESMQWGVSRIDYQRTQAPEFKSHETFDNCQKYRTNLITVGGDTFSNEVHLSKNLFSGFYNIGYWFWELEQVPDRIHESTKFVDEVWAPSRFIYDVFSKNLQREVFYVPFPIREPTFAPDVPKVLAEIGRPYVLCVFDYFSTVARKNPQSGIEAFKRTFPEPLCDGPILVVKSINGEQRPLFQRELRLLAGNRPDIRFIDQEWSTAQVLTATRDAVALMALHRAEGLGLHVADALWLGTPVVTTNYGGVKEFAGAPSYRGVPYTRVPVSGGEGIYDSSAVWAEPDVDVASRLLQEVCANSSPRQERKDREFMKGKHEDSLELWRQMITRVAS